MVSFKYSGVSSSLFWMYFTCHFCGSRVQSSLRGSEGVILNTWVLNRICSRKLKCSAYALKYSITCGIRPKKTTLILINYIIRGSYIGKSLKDIISFVVLMYVDL